MEFTKEQLTWLQNELHKSGVAVRTTVSHGGKSFEIQFENGYKVESFMKALNLTENANKWVKRFESM